MRPVAFTLLFFPLLTAAMAQGRSSEEAIEETRRAEVLDQAAQPYSRADLERYTIFVLLPLGALLLCIWAFRRNE